MFFGSLVDICYSHLSDFLVYEIICTILRFYIGDRDDFTFASLNRWLILVLDSLDGFNIEIIQADFPNKRIRFLGDVGMNSSSYSVDDLLLRSPPVLIGFDIVFNYR